MSDEQTWPCADCGKPRTKAQGGTIFTVCDDCWGKAYRKDEKRPTQTLMIAPTPDYAAALESDRSRLQRECEEWRTWARIWAGAFSTARDDAGMRRDISAQILPYDERSELARLKHSDVEQGKRIADLTAKLAEAERMRDKYESVLVLANRTNENRGEKIQQLTVERDAAIRERDECERELDEILGAILIGPLEAGTMQDTIIALRKGLDASLAERDSARAECEAMRSVFDAALAWRAELIGERTS